MRKAIIIGASSGLGLEVAKILKNDGWQLGVAARRYHLLEQTGADVMAELDVTANNAEAKFNDIIRQLGGLDLLFYASGIGKQNPSLQTDIEMNTAMTNVVGFTAIIGAAFRHMTAHGGGHIAVITSVAGTKGLGPAPSYSATKAYQSTYLQSLEQLSISRHLGITFTDIKPGFVATQLLSGNHRYPLLMQPAPVARQIVKAIYHKKHQAIIDWRWRIITKIWRHIPNYIWRHFKLIID